MQCIYWNGCSPAPQCFRFLSLATHLFFLTVRTMVLIHTHTPVSVCVCSRETESMLVLWFISHLSGLRPVTVALASVCSLHTLREYRCQGTPAGGTHSLLYAHLQTSTRFDIETQHWSHITQHVKAGVPNHQVMGHLELIFHCFQSGVILLWKEVTTLHFSFSTFFMLILVYF